MSSSFRYTARTPDGAFVAGTFASASIDEALAHLRARSLFITSLEPVGSVRGTLAGLATLVPASARERVTFFRSFATLIQAGVAMDRALRVTIDQCGDARFREALRSVASDVDAGSSLSAAMARRPQEFSRLFVALVHAGELAGGLDDVLERLAVMLERDRELQRRVTAALAYPAIVLIAAIALVLFLVVNIVPAFVGMFGDLHVALPLTTRLLIVVGTWLRSPFSWVLLIVVAAAGAALHLAGIRIRRVRDLYARVAIAAPILGRIIRKATTARLTRTLGTLVRSGVPLLAAIDATQEVIESGPYALVLSELAEAIRGGESIVGPFDGSSLFEPLVTQLVRVGVETGKLDAMLLRIAQYQELDVETALASLGAVIEPIVIIFLGAIVGTIVASILVPLYSIIGSIK